MCPGAVEGAQWDDGLASKRQPGDRGHRLRPCGRGRRSHVLPPRLSVFAALRLFAGEVVAGAIVWVAASLLLEGRIRWGLEAKPNEPRRALATVVGGPAFFVLLTAAILAFGWRSMSLVPIVVAAFLVWWLLADRPS